MIVELKALSLGSTGKEGPSWFRMGGDIAMKLVQSVVVSGVVGMMSTGGLAQSSQPQPSPPAAQAAIYAVTDVSVVDVLRGKLDRNRTVVIRNGKIASILRSARAIPAGARIVDGRGRFLAPGLADMHTHITSPNDLPLYVTYGVTTVRNMSGDSQILSGRQMIARGAVIGPRVITTGQIIDGPPKYWPQAIEVKTPEEASALVTKQKAEGYDEIKVYSNLSRDSFFAIAKTAKSLNIPIVGHVPHSVSVSEAIGVGMKSMEHLLGMAQETGRPGIDFSNPVKLGQDVIAKRLTFDQIYDAAKVRSLVKEVAASNTAVTPTMIYLRRAVLDRTQAAEQLARPETAFVTPFVRARWNPKLNPLFQRLTDEEIRAAQIFAPVVSARVKALSDAGALILAGSDAPNSYIFYGLSLHEELKLLVDAGLAPVAAIRASTSNAAKYMGEAGQWGVVHVGAEADLVLLSGNPLQDVGNYQKIDGVFLDGRWFDADALTGLRAPLRQPG
jgi:imidazolonepropionase-like amidohydrolase